MIYLAIDYGSYEGWRLEEYMTIDEAIQAVKDGKTYREPWKILKEIPTTIVAEHD